MRSYAAYPKARKSPGLTEPATLCYEPAVQDRLSARKSKLQNEPNLVDQRTLAGAGIEGEPGPAGVGRSYRPTNSGRARLNLKFLGLTPVTPGLSTAMTCAETGS